MVESDQKNKQKQSSKTSVEKEESIAERAQIAQAEALEHKSVCRYPEG